MPTKIDLADIPIIDHHAHALVKTNPPQQIGKPVAHEDLRDLREPHSIHRVLSEAGVVHFFS